MASTHHGPSESYRAVNGAVPQARLRDGDLNASGAILSAEDQHEPLDNELAALRDVLPNYIAATSTIQGFRYDCESMDCESMDCESMDCESTDCDSIDSQDAISAQLYDKIVVLSNAIRYIRYLEHCEQRLRRDKAALEARAKDLNA